VFLTDRIVSRSAIDWVRLIQTAGVLLLEALNHLAVKPFLLNDVQQFILIQSTL
jgi:hypothetical protein